MMNDHMRVAVLMGGPSSEHEISLKSGHGVLEALQRQGWRADGVVIPRELPVAEAVQWTASALRRLGCDAAFIALHGTFGEDGTIQQLCEDLQIAYTGSGPSASRLGMDKIASRQRFVVAGLSVPHWRAVPVHRHAKPDLSLVQGLRYPLVVKPRDQGSSIGVSRVERPGALEPALRSAGEYSDTAVVEEFIQGRELTVGVVGTAALPVIEIRPHGKWFDFSAKYTKGQTDYLVPAPLDPQLAQTVQDVAQRAHEALGCRHVSRTDILLDERRTPVVLEVNTIPGFTPTSLLPKAAAATGVSYESLCEQLILMACDRTGPVAMHLRR